MYVYKCILFKIQVQQVRENVIFFFPGFAFFTQHDDFQLCPFSCECYDFFVPLWLHKIPLSMHNTFLKFWVLMNTQTSFSSWLNCEQLCKYFCGVLPYLTSFRYIFRSYVAGSYGVSILIILRSLCIVDINLSIHSGCDLKVVLFYISLMAG